MDKTREIARSTRAGPASSQRQPSGEPFRKPVLSESATWDGGSESQQAGFEYLSESSVLTLASLDFVGWIRSAISEDA